MISLRHTKDKIFVNPFIGEKHLTSSSFLTKLCTYDDVCRVPFEALDTMSPRN